MLVCFQTSDNNNKKKKKKNIPIPCCCRCCVGEGEGAGEALLELTHSDTKDPFEWFNVEFRLVKTWAFAEKDEP